MSVSGRDVVVKIAEAFCEAQMRQFDRGDKRALLWAIFECAKSGIPLPPRCAEAFMRVMSHPPRTWDAVFGRPRKKHTKIHAKAQQEDLCQRVYVAVLNERGGFSWSDLSRAYRHGGKAAVRKLLVRQKKRKPLKVSLERAFARVAERYKIGESVCKQYYYDALKAKNKPRGKILVTATVMATGDVVTNFAK